MNKQNKAILSAHKRGYRVTKEGIATSPFGVLNPSCTRKGYKKITIRLEGKFVTVRLHRLQAYQKYGEEIFNSKLCVRHLNGNPGDNSWANIKLGSYSDNAMDRPKESRILHSRLAAKRQRKLGSSRSEA